MNTHRLALLSCARLLLVLALLLCALGTAAVQPFERSLPAGEKVQAWQVPQGPLQGPGRGHAAIRPVPTNANANAGAAAGAGPGHGGEPLAAGLALLPTPGPGLPAPPGSWQAALAIAAGRPRPAHPAPAPEARAPPRAAWRFA